MGWMRFVALVPCTLAFLTQARGLELRTTRGSRFDLELTGRLSGVPVGEARFVRWADLRALPTTVLRLNGEFVHGEQSVTVVFLGELMRALPVAAGGDTILATCSDGYASVYTSAFIARYRPFLVLEIDGKGPDAWPPPGLKFNPAPYAVSVSEGLVPDVADFQDVEHKKPWQVVKLEIASFAERFRGFHAGKWANLSPAGRAGREIWINSCASCHAGPSGTFGGTKADRPFEVIAAYAGYADSFFRRYVRDPKSLVPCAKMEPHPHYSDADLDALIAFITAGGR